ncbi:hypothetical protein CPB84DRAFT_1761676 [Gymnopilus junonius]|uniref:Uncharacterized protein n=1 Tax=Gymnopilus junonius TaxID=109634 RepID=A0A9P5TTE2_GYMJU|nr:hypothetical protein CPB84DRAFT_1761676 [Gymnopilus junonius]
MSHFPFSISFPKNKVSAHIPRESSLNPTSSPFPAFLPAHKEELLTDVLISRKTPSQLTPPRARPMRTMSLLEKTPSNPESSLLGAKRIRRIVRKPLGRRSESNLKAAEKGKHVEEQHATSSFDTPPPLPPKDSVPVRIPTRGGSLENRAFQKRGKILHHIPGFSDDEDDARTFSTRSMTSDSDAASSLQMPSTPAESTSVRQWESAKLPYEPTFTIEKEDRAIEPCIALTPPPFHHRRKGPVIQLP